MTPEVRVALRAPHAYPVQRPRLMACGSLSCAICRAVADDPPGEPPKDTLATFLLGGAVFVGLVVLMFVLLPELVR